MTFQVEVPCPPLLQLNSSRLRILAAVCMDKTRISTGMSISLILRAVITALVHCLFDETDGQLSPSNHQGLCSTSLLTGIQR